MDQSLNRGMCHKFESRKICVAGYQCDNSDFDFCNAEHNELRVIEICSNEGRNDCQQLKPKGTDASFGTTVVTVTILFIISILFSRVTVNILVFVLCVVFFHVIVYIVTRYVYDAGRRDVAASASFVLECFDGSEVTTRKGNEPAVQKENCVVEEINDVEYNSVGLNKVSHFSRRGCATTRLPNKQIKIFTTENTESETFCMEGCSEKYTIAV